MERHFLILGVGLTLSGPTDILAPIAFAYRRFETPAVDSSVRIHLESAEAPVLRIDGRAVPLVPGWDTVAQVYQQFLFELMDRVSTHAVLHAAALADAGGRAIVLAAPSGHGKSSLTLELARRGFAFLSDDYAPLDLDTRVIAPYPRTVGILPRESAPIPEPFRARALDPGAVRLFGKSLLDVGEVLGERALAREPLPLGVVVLLTATPGLEAEPLDASSWLNVGCRSEHAAELASLLAACPGVEVSERHGQHPVALFTLHLRHEAHPTQQLSRILDSDKVIYCEKQWGAKPDFASSPIASPIKRRQAAEYLGRELLNRRGAGGLLARYDGSATALFFELASALTEAECFAVQVGGCRETADMIESLVR